MSTASVIVSVFALGVSGFALYNSMRQRKIASEAHRLSLYQRRFAVFHTAMKYHADTIKKHYHEDHEVDEISLVSAGFEAQFLFDPIDQIPESIKKIGELVKTGIIWTGDGCEPSEELHDAITGLHKKVSRYLNFHQISVDEEKWYMSQLPPSLSSMLKRLKC